MSQTTDPVDNKTTTEPMTPDEMRAYNQQAKDDPLRWCATDECSQCGYPTSARDVGGYLEQSVANIDTLLSRLSDQQKVIDTVTKERDALMEIVAKQAAAKLIREARG